MTQLKNRSSVTCKTINIIIAVAWVLFAGQSAWAAPKAMVPKKIHEFEKVPEGTKINHTYVIKNQGDSVLNVLKVSPP